MSGDIDTPDDANQEQENSADEVSDDDIVLSIDDDIVDESTTEINVEELVAKVDADEAAKNREIREKLDALNEMRDDEFGSTYNFDLDEKL